MRILGFAVVGLLISDLTFLCVFWFYDYIPGGYWFILLGPLVEGFLGGRTFFCKKLLNIVGSFGSSGRTLMSATVNAYFADCTPPALRYVLRQAHTA